MYFKKLNETSFYQKKREKKKSNSSTNEIHPSISINQGYIF